jgi:maleylacetoacetate isomerase
MHLLSSPAKADDPVAADGTVITGLPACAGNDGGKVVILDLPAPRQRLAPMRDPHLCSATISGRRAMKFYSFWRSLASFRVRIALNIKGIVPDEVLDIDLLRGEQRQVAFRAINPQMLIPAIVDGDGPVLFQSLAIMEYLEETHPQPRLLPADPRGRARVRALSGIVASDSHPLIVPRIRNFMEHELKLDEPARMTWIRHWVNEGLAALEAHLARDEETVTYCHGEAVTMADICLVSHVVGAGFFKVDTAPYPTVTRIADTCLALDAFARAHPLKQPGAPTAGH